MSQQATDEERLHRLVAMGEMAAQIAHEIRNPLGSMELFCGLLKRDLKDQDLPETLQLAEQIHKGIRALDRIISSCLQFSKDIHPQKELVGDVGQYLQEMTEPFRMRAENEGVSFIVEANTGIAAMFDPHMIQQVITNLVLNAFDAVIERKKHAKGNYTAEIAVRARRSGSELIITVADTGIGLKDEVLQRLFDPFYTTKERGTGLGLSISYSIVKAHGGTLKGEGAEGAGATFELSLPGN
jgi:signal transduction histidine kinase